MRPHSNFFFSSLSRLEKRLKLETQQLPEQQSSTAKPPNQENNSDTTLTESLGSPIYLYNSHPTSTYNPTSSEPPQAFFPNSIDIGVSQIQESPDPETQQKVQETSYVNEIEMLLQLLGLDEEEEEQKGISLGIGEGEDEIFYGKIVGVKGPKSEKELERLNGWIKYLLNEDGDGDGDGDGGIKQPLRLAHLLLAKASFVHTNDDDDFEGPMFPPTVQDFLQYDPPVN